MNRRCLNIKKDPQMAKVKKYLL